MIKFKQFLMEGMQFVPGKGYVFVPDSSPTQIPTNPNPAATSSPTPESLKPYAQPVLSDIEKPPTQQPPRQTINVDPTKGVDINDIAEPMKDAKGNVTGYRIKGNVRYDEYNRPTVDTLRGSSNDIKIWEPKKGYSVTGTSDKIIQFAKQHGVDLRGGLADLLGDKGELVIPVKNNPNIQRLGSGVALDQPSSTSNIATNARRAGTAIKNFTLPALATAAGEKLAVPVQTAGEKTGVIDALAKGIGAVLPNSLLAYGDSPAEIERQEAEVGKKEQQMGMRSGSLARLPKPF